MLKKTKFISLILLSGALAVPVGAFAETAPFMQETNIYLIRWIFPSRKHP